MMLNLLTLEQIANIQGGCMTDTNVLQECIQLTDCQTGERWNDWRCKFKFVPCILPF